MGIPVPALAWAETAARVRAAVVFLRPPICERMPDIISAYLHAWIMFTIQRRKALKAMSEAEIDADVMSDRRNLSD
tara:strand:- start:99 stop:326 length:228 start_codon:yes stop_codon:yes gene_type:complete